MNCQDSKLLLSLFVTEIKVQCPHKLLDLSFKELHHCLVSSNALPEQNQGRQARRHILAIIPSQSISFYGYFTISGQHAQKSTRKITYGITLLLHKIRDSLRHLDLYWPVSRSYLCFLTKSIQQIHVRRQIKILMSFHAPNSP
jgi:hypothetical protein